MNELRGLEFIRNKVVENNNYIITELLAEYYCNCSCIERLEFPSDELLDLLHVYDGNDRRYVVAKLKAYAEGMYTLWTEYSLMSLMSMKLYFSCEIVSSGDLLLSVTPTSISQGN